MQISTEKAQYTRWLINHLGAETCKYIFLCSFLNGIEFYYLMPDDKNRVGDARELRNEYIDEFGDDILDDLPATVTVLEVLVSLSEKADWVIQNSPYGWFLTFLENLGLDFLEDIRWSSDGEAYTASIIHKWLDRRFSPNGSGSPFRSSKYDLTTVSMWDAMQWWLADYFGEGKL